MSLDQRPQINTKDVQDTVIRRNFQNIKDFFTAQGQLLDFQFYEAVFSGAESDRKITHTLGVVPKDVIVTRVTGAGTVTFQFGKFTKDEIYVSASGACRVRFFIGSVGDDSDAATTSSDYMAFSAAVGGSSSSSSSASTFSIDNFFPVGAMLWMPGVTDTLPSNLAWAEGGQFQISAYPTLAAKLWNATQSKWYAGGTATGPSDPDPSKYVNLPDMRGVVPRGWDSTATKDPDAAGRTAIATGGVTGNVPGSYQDNAIAFHRHQTAVGANANLNGWGTDTLSGVAGTALGTYACPRTGSIVVGASGTDTRMNNVTGRWAIRVK